VQSTTELCGGLGPQDKETPLHRAARYGHSESVQLLLTGKANPSAENLDKETPLQLAQMRFKK